jgi:hypothetical protein
VALLVGALVYIISIVAAFVLSLQPLNIQTASCGRIIYMVAATLLAASSILQIAGVSLQYPPDQVVPKLSSEIIFPIIAGTASIAGFLFSFLPRVRALKAVLIGGAFISVTVGGMVAFDAGNYGLDITNTAVSLRMASVVFAALAPLVMGCLLVIFGESTMNAPPRLDERKARLGMRAENVQDTQTPTTGVTDKNDSADVGAESEKGAEASEPTGPQSEGQHLEVPLEERSGKNDGRKEEAPEEKRGGDGSGGSGSENVENVENVEKMESAEGENIIGEQKDNTVTETVTLL